MLLCIVDLICVACVLEKGKKSLAEKYFIFKTSFQVCQMVYFQTKNHNLGKF
jgi:hypothetical protein